MEGIGSVQLITDPDPGSPKMYGSGNMLPTNSKAFNHLYCNTQTRRDRSEGGDLRSASKDPRLHPTTKNNQKKLLLTSAGLPNE
jgi:hypothetical protein